MSARAITCPACGGTVAVRAAGWSVRVACGHCGSELDIARPEVRVIAEWHRGVAALPLPLGGRGTLGGIEWEAIGAIWRGDGEDEWHEFLLFNPYAGYAWLVAADGDWSFGRMPTDLPRERAGGVDWRGKRFRPDGGAQRLTVNRVFGEFYWQVRSGDVALARSYVCAGETLSCEAFGGEVTWTCLTAVRAGEVAAAFGLEGQEDEAPPMASRAVENFVSRPAKSDEDLPAMVGMALVTWLVALLVMLLVGGGGQTLNQAMTVPVGRATTGTKLGTITVERPWQFVKIRARTSEAMTNRWIDLDYSLVNRATQRAIDANGLVEFYSGRDSDGTWTEGSHSTTTLVAGVPRGTYDVYVDTEAHGWPTDPGATPPTLGDGAAAAANPWALAGGSGSSGSWSSGDEETISVVFEAWPGAMPWGNWWSELALLALAPIVMIWARYRDGRE